MTNLTALRTELCVRRIRRKRNSISTRMPVTAHCYSLAARSFCMGSVFFGVKGAFFYFVHCPYVNLMSSNGTNTNTQTI